MNSISQPLVSVLMTVYNREAFIADAIQSVLNSTYQNWELIIVDDQSKDNSVTIAEKYASSDKRISLYINDENLGDYPNRNKAASYAKGVYLKYVDADDMLYPHGLELLVYYMEQFPDAGFGLCSMEQDENRKFPFQLSPAQIYFRNYIERKSVFHKAPLSSIIKRSVFEKEHGFANVRHYGDFEMWLRLSKKYNMVLMPHGIVWYRVSDGQEAFIRKKNPLNALKTFKAALDHIESPECPLLKSDKDSVILDYKGKIASLILFNLRKGEFSKALELKEHAKLSFIKILKYKYLQKYSSKK